jgi:uncharacterized protein
VASIVAFSRNQRPPAEAVAPWWHTLGLFVLFALLGIVTATFQRARPLTGAAPSPLALYVPLVAIELLLLSYVWWGLQRGGTSLSALVGGWWSTGASAARDLALAFAMWAAWMGINAVWSRLSGPSQDSQVAALLPHGPLGSLIWIVVSLSAGFVEETVFRGYFQRQFAAWTKSRVVGVLLQAILFGLAHGYQGISACLRIVVYGMLFGGVALWRGNLKPGIVAHAWTDIASGLLLA